MLLATVIKESQHWVFVIYLYLPISLYLHGFPGDTVVKNPPASAGDPKTQVGENPQELETATHRSMLAWEIPWTEGPGRLQSTEAQSRPWLSDCASTRSCLSVRCLELVIWCVPEDFITSYSPESVSSTRTVSEASGIDCNKHFKLLVFLNQTLAHLVNFQTLPVNWVRTSRTLF